MKDIWILLTSAFLMAAVLMTGRYLRGDFTQETARYTSVSRDLGNTVVVQDGNLLLNINAVDAEALTRLDGIGPALSERIIAYREEFGPFTSLDELLKVDGIGTKTLAKIRDQLICLP